MENIIENPNVLDFKANKVNTLTMQQLKMSRKPKNGAGQPLGGIYHSDFIETIQERAEKYGLNMSIWEMFAADNKERYLPGVIIDKELEERYGENAIQAEQLNRIFVNARIDNFDDEEYTTNVAISYHQKGIQVAVGSNVKICHNQMILGTKDFYAATYSDRGKRSSHANMPDPFALIDIVEGYLAQIGDRVYEQRRKLEEMKNIILTPEQIYIFIGMLQCARVQMDTKEPKIRRQGVYPLGNTEVNRFTEKILLLKEKNGEVSLRDTYDIATNLYKPMGTKDNGEYAMEIPNILPQNFAMTEFIEDWIGSYQLPQKSFIIER